MILNIKILIFILISNIQIHFAYLSKHILQFVSFETFHLNNKFIFIYFYF